MKLMKWIIYGQKMIEQSEIEKSKVRNNNKNPYDSNFDGRRASSCQR